MKYQLDLPFPTSSETDCDRLLSIEDAFEQGLGDAGQVRGTFSFIRMILDRHSSGVKPCSLPAGAIPI